MTIVVFLIDTSASMNQRVFSFGRPTLLDIAKGAVETFVKIRQRSPDSKGDRYMLLTFEDHPHHIKAGWKENLQTFTQELKNLQAFGMTNLGAAIKNTFDILNLNRMQSGIDMYGQGRCPFFLEPSVVVCVTDSGKLTVSSMSVMDELKIPRDSRVPGSELTRESYRWDQRFFSLVLRMAGTPSNERDAIGLVDCDTGGIDKFCEITGGRSYAVTSHRVLVQCIESLVQKIQSGVVISFEKTGPDPLPVTADSGVDDVNGEEGKENSLSHSNSLVSSRPSSPAVGGASQSWHSCRKLIYVPRSAQKGFPLGHWPIPEAFWPDVSSPTLPPRSSHPQVRFNCVSREPMVIDNLPFDKYELEPSPLTQFILSRKQPSVCWQVFISSSSKTGGVGHPFGYLKASTNLISVNLFVMPYNYPVLLPLLDELFKMHRLKPTLDWKSRFDNYIRTVPAYYAQPLRQALKRMGAPNLVPDTLDNGLSVNVINHLKRLKNQAKLEYERLCSEVATRQQAGDAQPAIRLLARRNDRKQPTSNPALTDKFVGLVEQMNDVPGVTLAVRGPAEVATHSYRNPFDIGRDALLDQLVRMRSNFLQSNLALVQLQDQDQLHNMPVGQMGNYQDYLKRMPAPLRELETTPVRQHMFGNPFKIDKRMMVDEADIDLLDKSPKAGGRRSADPTGGRSKQRRLMPPLRRPAPVIPDKPAPVSPPITITPPVGEPNTDPVPPVCTLLSGVAFAPADPPPPVEPAPPVTPPPLSQVLHPPPPAVTPPAAAVLRPPSPCPASSPPLEQRSGGVLQINHQPPPAAISQQPTIVSLHELEDDEELSEIAVPLSGGASAAAGGVSLSPPSSPHPSPAAAAARLSPVNQLQLPAINGLPTVAASLLVDRKLNRQLRQRCFQLVRRPGRDYSGILETLSRCSGSETERRQLRSDVMAEAARLKRAHLVDTLRRTAPGTNGLLQNGPPNPR